MRSARYIVFFVAVWVLPLPFAIWLGCELGTAAGRCGVLELFSELLRSERLERRSQDAIEFTRFMESVRRQLVAREITLEEAVDRVRNSARLLPGYLRLVATCHPGRPEREAVAHSLVETLEAGQNGGGETAIGEADLQRLRDELARWDKPDNQPGRCLLATQREHGQLEFRLDGRCFRIVLSGSQVQPIKH
jgi:hypothetical protein